MFSERQAFVLTHSHKQKQFFSFFTKYPHLMLFSSKVFRIRFSMVSLLSFFFSPRFFLQYIYIYIVVCTVRHKPTTRSSEPLAMLSIFVLMKTRSDRQESFMKFIQIH